MSLENNRWPLGMYSKETWENEGDRDHKALLTTRSAPVVIKETADKRKCLYGQGSFSRSPEDARVLRELQSSSEENMNASHCSSVFRSGTEEENSKPGSGVFKKENSEGQCQSPVYESDTNNGRNELRDLQRVSFQLGENDQFFSDHTYENITFSENNCISESTEKSSTYSSCEFSQPCSESFENGEYMSAGINTQDGRSSQIFCQYSIPKCNCIIKKKTASLRKETPYASLTFQDVLESRLAGMANGPRDSSGYMCMDAYIHTNTVSQTLNKDKYHIYENEKGWIKKELPINANEDDEAPVYHAIQQHDVHQTLAATPRIAHCPDVSVSGKETCLDRGTQQSNRLSSQSFRKKERRKNKYLDHGLLEATLAQQETESSKTSKVGTGLTEEVDGLEDLPETGNAGYKTTDQKVHSSRLVHLPNIHPKLIRFFKSSITRTMRLEEDLARKDLVIVWPQTDEGVLALQSRTENRHRPRKSNTSTEDEIINAFQKYIRNYTVDDSISVAREIGDELSTLLNITPLVSKCAIFFEHMNFFIIGEKPAVEECRRQLLALIKYLELRLQASSNSKITKTKYLSRHQIRIVFESKLVERFRAQYEGLQVDACECDMFEFINFTGDMESVHSAEEELYEHLQKVQGTVYKCSKLVRLLLNNAQVKSILRQLFRTHGLVCAWRIADSVCIIYGLSQEDIQFMKTIIKKVLVTVHIKLSPGQRDLMQSRLGMTEIKVMKKQYDGCLEADISSTSLELACVQRIQEDVCKRLKKFLYEHDIIKTAQEMESGIFQWLQRFSWDKVTALKQRCKNILVEMTWFEEESKCGFLLTGKRDFCKIAIQDLEKLLSHFASFEHTIRRAGLTTFLRSDKGRAQISELELKTQCILYLPDGNPVSQNKVCVCTYSDKEIMVLQDDINTIASGIAYIPCSSSCEDMRHKVEGDMSRKLVVRECMASPDTNHPNKTNFFACLPEDKSWGVEVRDAVQASVGLCLQEGKKRDFSLVSFATSTSSRHFPDYARVLVETIKTYIDAEGRTTKLQTVVFSAKDGDQVNSFVQSLKHVFGCKHVQDSGPIIETTIANLPSTSMDVTAEEVDSAVQDRDSHMAIDVILVKDEISAIKEDAIFIPTNDTLDLPQDILQMYPVIAEKIKDKLRVNFPSGLATGQVVSMTCDVLHCDLLYMANLGQANTNKKATRKILETALRDVLDRCVEDEVETLALSSLDSGIYLLAEILFDIIEPLKHQHNILQSINILIDPKDRTSYLPFEAMRKRFHDKTTRDDPSDCLKCEESLPKSKDEEQKASLSFGSVKCEILMGDITKETAEVVVNSVHANLDMSLGRLTKAVSEAAGNSLQTELRTKQNASKIRRDGFVVTGPGKMHCRYIFHVKTKGSIEGWKTVITACLHHAESLGIRSIAFPALGTGRKGIKPDYFTKSILKCIRNFAVVQPKSLQQIRILIFENTVFETVIQAANTFKSRKRRHTLKDRICEMLKKETPKQTEEEVKLRVYTTADNVDNVKRQINELCTNCKP